jgi:hypothetical protein
MFVGKGDVVEGAGQPMADEDHIDHLFMKNNDRF